MRQKIVCMAVRISAAFLFMFISGSLLAQKKVTGTVTNAKDKQPVGFATVMVKGTNIATATTTTGTFIITVPAGKNTLVVSSVGFDDAEVSVASSDNVSVVLKEKTSSLDEIVVTGYTSQKKKTLTGAVSVVNVKELKDIPAGSPEQMLQGKASGVTITTTGQPGNANSIHIRGITSFGNTNPLVIIDGVPGNLHDINAADIESLQILKDAAASIYGVRGSNGVIVVTTKKGKGKATISYDGYYGTQRPPTGNVFNLANPSEMAQIVWNAQKNSGQVPTHPQYGSGAQPVLPDYILSIHDNGNGSFSSVSGFTGTPTAAELAAYNIDYSKGPILQIMRANKTGTDWFHEVFKPAPIQNHNISASGGNDRSSYFFSLNYFDQQGSLINTYLKRYSVRANTVFNVKDHIRVGENAYIFFKSNPQISNQSENVIGTTFREQPIIPVYDINGGWGGTKAGGLGNALNPVEQQWEGNNNVGNDWQINGNVFAEADFLNHFTARTSFGGNIDNYYYYYYGYHRYSDAEVNTSNSFTEGAGYNRSWTWSNTIAYKNQFGKHDVNVLGGVEAIEDYGRSLFGSALGFFTNNPLYRFLGNASPGSPPNGSSAYQSSIYSQFGQVNYAYDEKYLLSGTIRRDGSSKFGPNSRYGTFPSVSAGWVVTRESFMKGVNWLNNLKIRGSWGKLGNDLNVNPANAFDLFGAGFGTSYYDIAGTSTSTVQGFYATRYGNPATSWEEDKLTNIGLDATVFKNKFDFSIEWYKKSISGLLFGAQAGATVGGGSLPVINIGNVENKGIDLAATYHGSVGRDFKFDISGTFSHYKSNITSIPGGGYFDDAFLRIQPLVRNAVGHPISAFFGYQTIGLFQSADDVAKSPTQPDAAPGRFKFADINGDGKIDASDRTFIGDPNPDFTYGVNLSASYKGFDFSMFLYGSHGNDIINYTKYWTDFYPSFQGTKSKDLLYNSWTPQNTNAKLPINETGSNFSNNVYPNSYYLENGSYLRCKSLIIGYTIPAAILKRVGVDKFRVYVQAANLFTITKYSGLDPEIAGPVDGNTGQPSNSNFGIDQANYPNIRTFIAGINLSF